MSSRGKDEIYTCIGVLLLILAIGLYVVWSYYGLWPFVIGGFFVAIFAAYLFYNSRKSKHAQLQTTSQPTLIQPILSAFQHATPEEREKMLEARGFTKYTDENGNTRWQAPEGLADWAKAEKINVILKDGSIQVEMEKEGPKIRCSYCGTIYDAKLDQCPNCGAKRQGNEEQVQDSSIS